MRTESYQLTKKLIPKKMLEEKKADNREEEMGMQRVRPDEQSKE